MDRQRIFQRVKHDELGQRIRLMLARKPQVPAKSTLPPIIEPVAAPPADLEETAPMTPPPAHVIEDPAPVEEVMEPAAPAATADEMPDFDSMTPEEMMEWMESLAKRQGVSDDQLLTKADAKVAEVDPTKVDQSVLDQEYIPYGWSKERWEQQLAKDAAAKKKP